MRFEPCALIATFRPVIVAPVTSTVAVKSAARIGEKPPTIDVPSDLTFSAASVMSPALKLLPVGTLASRRPPVLTTILSPLSVIDPELPGVTTVRVSMMPLTVISSKSSSDVRAVEADRPHDVQLVDATAAADRERVGRHPEAVRLEGGAAGRGNRQGGATLGEPGVVVALPGSTMTRSSGAPVTVMGSRPRYAMVVVSSTSVPASGPVATACTRCH